MSKYLLGMAVAGAAAMAGCMLGPTDGERVTSTAAQLPFNGYDTEANGQVQVKAWDFSAHALAQVGPTVRADSSGITPAGGLTLYAWSNPQVLPARFWHAGPGGGSCAVISPQTTHANGTTYNMITVDDDWAACWNADPNTADFYNNCRSAHSPLALLYTEDWGNVVVGNSPSDWNTVNLLASAGVHITFDNYTPNAFSFCSDSTPAGCPQNLPAGYPTDANTYKFFQPNASSISTSMTGAASTYTFSINPSRQDPMTIYIDNMVSRSVDFHVANGKLVFGINFTDTGPEIRMNCINNFFCGILDGRTITFASPRAEITFGLTLVGGRVQFTDVSTTFATGNTDADSISAGNAIAAAITQNLTGDANIRASVNAALDTVVHMAGRLGFIGPTLAIESLSLSGSTMTIQPACAEL